MAKFLVKTPVPDYSGTLGDISFHNGRAVVDEDTHPAELAYCRARYTVEPYTGDAIDEEDEQKLGPVDQMPRKSASKADWAAYAIAHGMSPEEAESLNRDQLAERFTTPKENEQ